MPSTIVKMPQLGESIAEGTIGRWLKQPGDRIERDEPLVEVQTDKVNAEVPSPVAGTLQRILQPEGATISVLTDIAVIGDGADGAGEPDASAGDAENAGNARGNDAAQPPIASKTSPRTQGPEGVNPHRTASEAKAAQPEPLAPRTPLSFTYDNSVGGSGVVSAARDEEEGAEGPATDGKSVASDEPRRFYTPVVLRMAQEHGLDLSAIQGTGLGGRVTRKDVERALAASAAPAGVAASGQLAQPRAEMASVAARAATPPALEQRPTATPVAGTAGAPPVASGPDIEVHGLTPMRRTIAQHMSRARADIPDAWSMVEVDVTCLVRRRAEALAEFQAREGFELTYLPFFVRAVLAGLRAVPEMNASWQGDSIGIHRRYHLGIAVSVENGLVVPVLRDADQYSVAGLARALRALVQNARSGKLALEDLEGATFTVNNPGALGSIMSQPIVPVGQAGIVTMEAIVKRPVVTADDAIAVRSLMNCCLSFDHRILDGSQALRFLAALRGHLERADEPVY